jgi:GntR family transcriptional regulator/MocR family aminotransferase
MPSRRLASRAVTDSAVRDPVERLAPPPTRHVNRFGHSAVTRTRRKAELIPYIPFDRASKVPFYTQIHNGYLAAIVSGRLRPGQRLPSTRALADELHVSRMPVLYAFEQLLHEGYLEGRVGSGTYVRTSTPQLSAWIGHRWKAARFTEGADGDDETAAREDIGLFSETPAFDRFPHQIWERLLRRHASYTSTDLLARGDSAGYLPLRRAIAEHLGRSRDIDCRASQVFIVSGSQMGLRMCAMALAPPDSTICMEQPGSPSARAALEIPGTHLVPVATDEGGIDVGAVARSGKGVRLTYVTPAHQDPLGITMNATRGQALLAWAEQNDAWVVEGDYDSEFRYSGRTAGALRAVDQTGRVIYLGTFSTTLFPDIGLGYLVIPRTILPRFARLREGSGGFTPKLYQRILTDFLVEGHFARHVGRMKRLYAARRNALIQALSDVASDVLTVGQAEAGLRLVAFLPAGIDDREVVRLAMARQMFPKALSSYYADGCSSRSGLVLGFGGGDEGAMTRAVGALAGLIRTLR